MWWVGDHGDEAGDAIAVVHSVEGMGQLSRPSLVSQNDNLLWWVKK